jgi:hypothetical protein
VEKSVNHSLLALISSVWLLFGCSLNTLAQEKAAQAPTLANQTQTPYLIGFLYSSDSGVVDPRFYAICVFYQIDCDGAGLIQFYTASVNTIAKQMADSVEVVFYKPGSAEVAQRKRYRLNIALRQFGILFDSSSSQH